MKKIESQIADKCGDKTQSALKFYANTCNAAGHKVGKDILACRQQNKTKLDNIHTYNEIAAGGLLITGIKKYV
jgi:hypothetical protein